VGFAATKVIPLRTKSAERAVGGRICRWSD
jgi:hypothetical protein